MTTPKRPGWGLRILDARAGPQGQPQGLICPPDHEACFWTDLREVAQHRSRIIYNPLDSDDNICQPCARPDHRDSADGAPCS